MYGLFNVLGYREQLVAPSAVEQATDFSQPLTKTRFASFASIRPEEVLSSFVAHSFPCFLPDTLFVQGLDSLLEAQRNQNAYNDDCYLVQKFLPAVNRFDFVDMHRLLVLGFKSGFLFESEHRFMERFRRIPHDYNSTQSIRGYKTLANSWR